MLASTAATSTRPGAAPIFARGRRARGRLGDAEEIPRQPSVRRRRELALVVRAAALGDGDARLERASGVQADEFSFGRVLISPVRLSAGFQRRRLRLADHANLVPSLDESADVHVESRDGDGGGEIVSGLVREDVEDATGDGGVLAP